MSYLTESHLEADWGFRNRSRAALTEQARIFANDARADIAALAVAMARDDNAGAAFCFYRLLAAAPGFAAKVDQGDGQIDSARITDAELLAAVQAEWPTVAALYYDPDGNPRRSP